MKGMIPKYNINNTWFKNDKLWKKQKTHINHNEVYKKKSPSENQETKTVIIKVKTKLIAYN